MGFSLLKKNEDSDDIEIKEVVGGAWKWYGCNLTLFYLLTWTTENQ